MNEFVNIKSGKIRFGSDFMDDFMDDFMAVFIVNQIGRLII